MTSDGKRRAWKVDGPYFAGWDIYHAKGSPADLFELAMQCLGDIADLDHRSHAICIETCHSHVKLPPDTASQENRDTPSARAV